jgi:hypothetical protein
MAGQTKQIELRFPAGGVYRRAGYRDSQDVATVRDDAGVKSHHTTPWAVNARPQDVLARRFRGGSRPAFSWGSAVTTPTLPVIAPTAGSTPAYTFGTLYRDRLLLAGSGQGIYCSRQGSYGDWAYGASVGDPARPVVFQLSEGGSVGNTPTALIPHKDSHLIIGTAGELWLLAGDPATGSLQNLSRNAGIVGPRAWAKNDETVFFLASDGLQTVPATGGEPQNLSREKIPLELLDVDGADCLLAYSDLEKGLYIFIEGATYHWFFDLVGGGFWPFTTSVVPNQATTSDGLLTLARNGMEIVIGGTESFTSDVLIGPLRMSSPGNYGRVLNFKGTLGAGSGEVTWKFVLGDTAEAAVENARLAILGDSSYVASYGTLSAGQSHLWYPRVRSPWLVAWLSSTNAWAYESLALELSGSGKWR